MTVSCCILTANSSALTSDLCCLSAWTPRSGVTALCVNSDFIQFLRLACHLSIADHRQTSRRQQRLWTRLWSDCGRQISGWGLHSWLCSRMSSMVYGRRAQLLRTQVFSPREPEVSEWYAIALSTLTCFGDRWTLSDNIIEWSTERKTHLFSDADRQTASKALSPSDSHQLIDTEIERSGDHGIDGPANWSWHFQVTTIAWQHAPLGNKPIQTTCATTSVIKQVKINSWMAMPVYRSVQKEWQTTSITSVR